MNILVGLRVLDGVDPDPGIRRDDGWRELAGSGRSVAAAPRRVIPGLTRDLASGGRPARPRDPRIRRENL